jgi:hypothetical protein
MVVLGFWLAGCGPSLVTQRPTVAMLDSTYDATAVRDAVVRAINRGHMLGQSEGTGMVGALGTKRPACAFQVRYTQADVAIDVSSPNAPAGSVDQRCLEQSDRFAKAIRREVGRPAREAMRDERRRQRHELAVEQARAFTAQMELQQQQLAAQQQADADAQAQAQADDGQAQQDAPAAPAPVENNTTNFNWQNNNTSIQSNSNTTVNRTTIHQAQPSVQGIRPLSVCYSGQVYQCPNGAVQAAAIRSPREAPRLCHAYATSMRVCP